MAGHEYLLSFLDDEKIRYKQKGNVIQFCLHGINYFAIRSETEFLQISVLLKTKEDAGELQLLRLCNELNSEKFVTKFIIIGKRVWCNIEFVPSAYTKSASYIHALKILDHSSDEFLIRMGRLSPQ
jgi:hypothetical protein